MHPPALCELAKLLDRAREDVGAGKTHLTKFMDFQGGEGVINRLTQGHQDAYRALDDWLGKLGDPTDDMGGRVACEWTKDNGSPLEVLRVQVLKDYGLAKISAECKIECDTWSVTEVAGYPAIHANGRLESKYGMCRLYVGLSDSSSLLVTDGDITAMQKAATQGTASGPKCARADQAAGLAVRKLRESR